MNLTYINVTFTGKVLRWKLYLQDKDFDLYHVSGKEEHQFVPDALSRLCVNNIPPPPTLADRMIVALRPAIDIPPEIYERLTEVHNSNRGHGGLKLCKHRLKGIQQLRLDRHLPPQDKISTRMINEFIRQCPYCQISNRLKIPIKTHPFTCASYNPFEVLHLDHIGPLPKDAHDNEYILVIIDAFSRWVELFPTKSTTALETASIILNHIGRFGSPEVIHTDQGPAFHNELVTELLRLGGIEQSFATAYSSEENGIVERANQEVLRHLRALLFDSRVHDKWSFEQLPLVQRIMNTVEKTSTGVTPAELILSYSIRLSSNILAPIDTSVDSSDTSLSDRMDEWISRQHTLLIVARENQQQSDQHRLVENDAEITDYPINSYVLYTPPMGRSNKLLPKHKGPYQVIGHEHSIYIIEDLIRGKRIQTHIHNLRPFIFDPHHIDPMEIAQQNEQEFQVREIVAHRGNHRRRSTMEFLVRWTGYDMSSNSWEPYKALMHVDKLHDYLRLHRMRSLIPKEHK
jgi:transposase InsO family protein